MVAGAGKSGLGVVTYTDSRGKVVEQKPLGIKPEGTSKKAEPSKVRDDEKAHKPADSNQAKELGAKTGVKFTAKGLIQKRNEETPDLTPAKLAAAGAARNKQSSAKPATLSPAEDLSRRMMDPDEKVRDQAFAERNTMMEKGTPEQKQIAKSALNLVEKKYGKMSERWTKEWTAGLSSSDPKKVEWAKAEIESALTNGDQNYSMAARDALKKIPPKVLFSESERSASKEMINGKGFGALKGVLDQLYSNQGPSRHFEQTRALLLAEETGKRMAGKSNGSQFHASAEERKKAFETMGRQIPDTLPASVVKSSFRDAFNAKFADLSKAMKVYSSQKEVISYPSDYSVGSVGGDIADAFIENGSSILGRGIDDQGTREKVQKEKGKRVVELFEEMLTEGSSASPGERKIARSVLLMVHHRVGSEHSPLSSFTRKTLGVDTLN